MIFQNIEKLFHVDHLFYKIYKISYNAELLFILIT